MASPNNYKTGAGGSTGDTLATASQLDLSGHIWYVHSGTGTDAASPRGRERVRPLATLAQAHTNAAVGDIIDFLSGHAETLTASQIIAKAGLRLVSEGTGTSRARFTCNGAVVMFDVTAAGVLLGNLYLPQSTTAPTPARVQIAAVGCDVRGCYFECGANDTVEALRFASGAGQCSIRDTTFISTATSVAAQPESAVAVTAAMSDLTLDNVVFDGGTTGWSNPFTFDAQAAITRLMATNVDLLRDSDMTVATGSVYVVGIRNRSGSARVVLTA